jgi:hypothetical protein
MASRYRAELARDPPSHYKSKATQLSPEAISSRRAALAKFDAAKKRANTGKHGRQLEALVESTTAMKATGEDSNVRIRNLEVQGDENNRMLRDLTAVCVDGRAVGGSGMARLAQIRLAKASLTTQATDARCDAKDEQLGLMAQRVERFQELAAASDDARLQIVANDAGIGDFLKPLLKRSKPEATAAPSADVSSAAAASSGDVPMEKPAHTEEEFKRLTVAVLKRWLVHRGKPVGGIKAELVARCLE